MKDNFSKQAGLYAQYRPVYPQAWYNFLYAQLKNTQQAWDAGTGNGQVAAVLAQTFEQVLATDISEKQLSHAVQAPNITYRLAAEVLEGVPDDTFDLITVAQAIHWFNRPVFYKEVQRVAKRNALLAVWGYNLLQVNDEVDQLITHFYKHMVGPYWDNERKLVDEAYKTIDFPFEETEVPPYNIQLIWNADALEGYLNTWSAVQHFIKANGFNPVVEFMEQIRPIWKEELPVTFPLYMRLGKIHS